MKRHTRTSGRGLAAGGLTMVLALTALTARGDEAATAGVVRITKAAKTSGIEPVSAEQMQPDSETIHLVSCQCDDCQNAGKFNFWGPDEFTPTGTWTDGFRYRNWATSKACEAKLNSMCQSCDHGAAFHARTQVSGQMMSQYLRCKFGFMIPTGCGGAGCPPMGSYARVYPVDPHYFDGRDGRLYSAQGYGTPMGVPLAPVVGHTYNYGWGLPASRLTPVSRVAPY